MHLPPQRSQSEEASASLGVAPPAQTYPSPVKTAGSPCLLDKYPPDDLAEVALRPGEVAERGNGEGMQVK